MSSVGSLTVNPESNPVWAGTSHRIGMQESDSRWGTMTPLCRTGPGGSQRNCSGDSIQKKESPRGVQGCDESDSGRQFASGFQPSCLCARPSSPLKLGEVKKECQPGGIRIATQALHNLSPYCLFISGLSTDRPRGRLGLRPYLSYLSPSTKRVILLQHFCPATKVDGWRAWHAL